MVGGTGGVWECGAGELKAGWVGGGIRGEGGAGEIVSTEVGDACMIEDPQSGQ